jgi:hypothetical protein
VEKSSSKQRWGLPPLKDLKGGSKQVRITAVIAVAIAVALVIWLLASAGGSDSSSSTSESTPPAQSGGKSVAVVPESGLLKALEGVGYPVYWAGPRIGVEFEVSRLPQGRTYVRYLPKGEEAGSKQTFLTIGSYEQPEALAGLRKLGQSSGAILVKIPGGGSAYAESPEATSAYMAFPGVDVQIEVYDPESGKALQLIRSGAVVPIG